MRNEFMMSCIVGFLSSLISLRMRENRTILSILVFLVNNCSFSRLTTKYGNVLLQLGLLRITTTCYYIYDNLIITIIDNCYYNLRTGITIHDIQIIVYYRTHAAVPGF